MTGRCRPRTDAWALTTVSLAAFFILLFVAPARAALTGAARLAAVYDTILEGHFEDVEAQLQQACPPAPDEACTAMRVVSAWWEILLDPDNRQLDARFNALADAAIAASEAWTEREPERAEAWFYLAGSYAPLVQWRVLRGERVAAARGGNRIKEALERALELDPSLDDAYFGIGLYHYYADVAPAAAKVLRFFLFLPGGDRAQGLQEMLQARRNGVLLRGEADYQLHLLYLWYEHQPGRAVELLEDLDARYPTNPLFRRQIAEIQDAYFHDHPASAAAWRTLLDRAHAGRVVHPARTELRARLGIAVQLDAMFETDRAIDELNVALASAPQAWPYGARARAHLLLGAAYDRMGQRERAVKAYTAAAAEAPANDTHHFRDRARTGLHEKPDARDAESYRLSLEGWRAFERGAAEDADALLTRAIALAPSDAVARYRHARVLEARGETARARAMLDYVISRTPPAPPIVLASAFVAYARLLEHAGDAARAVTMYQYAIDVVGGDPLAHADAVRAVKRLAGAARSKDF